MKEEIYKSFNESNGFIKDNEFILTELDENHARLEYKIKDSGLNPIGIVHGGLLFGLADSAAGALASMSGKFPLTTSSSINYLNQAKGNKLYAIATILKQGNNIGYYEVKIYNDMDEIVCVSNVNMYFINKK